MNKLLETIQILNGVAQWLEFHNERLNKTRKILFNATDTIDLKNFIRAPPQNGIYKCRVIYAKTVESVEYDSYQAKNFHCFRIIDVDDLVYTFKYLNREQLNRLFMLRREADDVLIIKQGLVTDTSIANVAFWDEDKWITPVTPLLKGTTRERLLRKKQIFTAEIQVSDLKNFSWMAIMNALLGFYVIEDLQLI